jgi:hypothetical protein
MKHLNYEFDAGENNIINVYFDNWVYVRLMDDLNYQNYKNKIQYSYYGSKTEVSPYSIRPPYNSHWHLVVDREGENDIAGVSVKLI